MTQNNTAAAGSPILGLLGIAFVVLKLTHVIDWSWWWVTLPFWIGFAILFTVLVAGGIVWGIAKLIYVATTPKEQRRRDKALADVKHSLEGMARSFGGRR